MNMEEQTMPIVPFGRYKDKSVLELLADANYVEWLKRQAWFPNQKQIYNIVVHQTIPTSNNSKTPEHNKLQNYFLEKSNQIKLLNIVLGNVGTKFKTHFKKLILDEDFINCFGKIDMQDICRQMKNSKIVFEDKYNWDFILYYRDNQWENFETKYDINNSSSDFVPGDKIDGPGCEKDPKLRYLYNIFGKYKFNYNYSDTERVLELYIIKNEDNNNYHANICTTKHDCIVCCELKPILSDDYPSVLRKMKTQIDLTENDKNLKRCFQYYILIIGSFTSKHTTKKDLISIFKQSNISIIFTDEIIEPQKSHAIEYINTNTNTDTLLETQSLKTQKQPKSIKDYFGKK